MMEYSTTIRNAHQLQLAGTTLGADYTLANDIDMTSAFTNTSEVWATNRNTTTGDGFKPIGSFSSRFTGSLNGQNYTISNLYMSFLKGESLAKLFSTHPPTEERVAKLKYMV